MFVLQWSKGLLHALMFSLYFQVFIANMVFRVGLMEYRQTFFEYPPGRYGIIGGVCALILLIILIILLFLYRKYSRRPFDRGYHAPSNNRLSHVGSDYSGERQFPNYVPRAVRQTSSSYSGSGGYSRNFDNAETMGRRGFLT